MKKFNKTIISLLLIGAVSSATAFSFATHEPPDEEGSTPHIVISDYLLYEDFSGTAPGSLPSSLNFSAADGITVKTAVDKTDKKREKNVLKVVKTGSGNGGFTLNLKPTKNTMLFEMRFRWTKTSDKYTSFVLDAYDNNKHAVRSPVWSGGGGLGIYSSAGFNQSLTGGNELIDGEWYTYRLLFDNEAKTASAMLMCEAFKGTEDKFNGAKIDRVNGASYVKNVLFNTEYDGKTINKIKFETTATKGEYSFDYISVKEGVWDIGWKGQKPSKIIPPFMQMPSASLLPYKINLSFNGEYFYTMLPPEEDNGIIYAALKDIASAYDFEVSYETNEIKLVKTGKSISITSGEKIKINGSEYKLNSKIKETAGFTMLPVEEFTKLLGDSYEYNKESKLISIKEVK